EGAERLTFEAWVRAADGLAATLADRGVRPGDVVALWLPTSIDYATCYAAAARLGAVATGINTRLGPREVDAILERSQPAIVIRAPFDRRLVGTPFPHAGYMAKLWDQLAWGSTVVISPTPWTAGDMLRLLVDERITVAGGVPTQWAKLLEHPDLEQADVSSLR